MWDLQMVFWETYFVTLPPNEMIWRDGIQDMGLHVLCLLSAFNEAGEESAAFPPQSHSAGSKRAVACVP